MMNRDNERDNERDEEIVNDNEAMNEDSGTEDNNDSDRNDDNDNVHDDNNDSDNDSNSEDEDRRELNDLIEDINKNRLLITDVRISEKSFARLCDAIADAKNRLTSIAYESDSFNVIGSEQTTDVINGQLLTSISLCSNLTSLDLDNTPINDENMHILADIIRNNPNLSNLSLNNCTIDGGKLKILSEVFAEVNFDHLETIYLLDNNLELANVKSLTTLKNIKSLKTLYLDECHINDDMMITIADLIINSNLKYLSLSYNPITHLGIKNFCQALTIARLNNPESVRPFALDLISISIDNKGLLALAEFIEKGGPLQKLSIQTTATDLDDSNLLTLIAATNKNPYIHELHCTKQNSQEWSPKILTAVSKELQSNSTLKDIYLGPWDESLIIDMLKYNFTFQSISTTNNPSERLTLALCLNRCLALLLNKYAFANIGAINEIFFIMEMKQNLFRNNIPKSLFTILHSIFKQHDFFRNVIIDLYQQDRKVALKTMCSALQSVQTSKFQEEMEKLLLVYDNLHHASQYINKAPQRFFGFNVSKDPLILSIICKAEVAKIAASPITLNQTEIIIPTIAFQIPSLKDLCFHMIALAVIHNEESHDTLRWFKSVLIKDLGDELNHIERLLPQLSVSAQPNESDRNLGIQLISTNKETQTEENDDESRGNEKAIVPWNLRLTNSKH